jgi:hypothetical protein
MGEPRDDSAGAYDPLAETDPLRCAAHIVSDLLTSALLQTYRRPQASAALKGDIERLYVWERAAVEWLLQQTARDPQTVLNLWAYDLVRTVRAKRGAADGT